MINWLKHNRFLLARRFCQIGILGLFVSSFMYDWKLFGLEPLEGNLTASRLFETIPLSDPFTLVQLYFSGQSPIFDMVIGALIVVVFYFLVGGRAFCSWVCPVNIISDSAQKARYHFKIPTMFKIDRQTRYLFFALSLALSSVLGVAAFEWISPIGIIHRELIFGMKMGWLVIIILFLFDIFIQKQAWCGHLCPLGAFYSLVGKWSLLRVRFDKEGCDKCGDCHRVCPEPQVLNLNKIFKDEMVVSGNCTNCGRCITICHENCFQFSLRTIQK